MERHCHDRNKVTLQLFFFFTISFLTFLSTNTGVDRGNQVWYLKMDEDHNIAEHSLSARERALQEKIVRLERKLEGYESEIGNTRRARRTHL